jgi:ATP-binding cassette subfamily C protein CydD
VDTISLTASTPNNASIEPKKHNGRAFLNKQLSKQKPALYKGVLAGSLSTVLLILQWLSFSFAVEKIVIDGNAFTSQYLPLFLFGIAVLVQPVLGRVQAYYLRQASAAARTNIRHLLMHKWRTLSPTLLQHYSPGALATQWVEEVETMDGYFYRYWPQQMLCVISPLLIICTVFYLNWLCGILLLISAPLIPIFMILVGMGAEKLNQKHSVVRLRLAGHFLDRVANMTTISLLGAQKEVLEEVSERSNHYRRVIMRTLKVAFLSSTVLEFFTSVAIASLAIYIGFSLFGAIAWGPAASLSLFSGLAILMLAPEFFQPLRKLSEYYHDRAAALGAADGLMTFLNDTKVNVTKEHDPKENSISGDDFFADYSIVKAPVKADSGAVHPNKYNDQYLKPIPYTLRLNDLVLGVEEGSPLNTPINIALDTGKLLVVSGSSGSGKTTLLNTIAGFQVPICGKVELNASQKRCFAYLPQQAWIKNDTIYNNLIALAPNATQIQMHHALEIVGLDKHLREYHEGLDTLLGEHGQGLSGGQIQRIAFSRILLNPAPVIVLDEPTAKLDIQSRQVILNALTILKPASILIIATHDPMLIKIADYHINLDELSLTGDKLSAKLAQENVR